MTSIIDSIHFDLDSVLYIPTEFLEATLALTIKVMIQTGLKASFDDALKTLKQIRSFDSNAENHFDQLCLHFNGNCDPIIIAAGVEKYWDCKIGNMTCAPDTRLILNQLYQSFPLAIISNGKPVKQAGKIYRLGLWHYFSRFNSQFHLEKRFFYASLDNDKQKPYSYLWKVAQKDINFRFSHSVMVGDRFWQDILGSKKLSMVSIKINQGPHAAETMEEVYEKKLASGELEKVFGEKRPKDEVMELMAPDFTISSLREIIPILPQIEEKIKSKS